MKLRLFFIMTVNFRKFHKLSKKLLAKNHKALIKETHVPEHHIMNGFTPIHVAAYIGSESTARLMLGLRVEHFCDNFKTIENSNRIYRAEI